MNTRSGRTYGSNRNPQQHHDLREDSDVIHQIGLLTKRVDAICAHLFNKPSGSGEKTKDEELGKETEKEDSGGDLTSKETQPHYTSPFLETRQTSHSHMFDYMPCTEGPNFFGHAHNFDSRSDDITRRIRVDVPEFHGKLDPHAFQDWLTSLEDYFEWLNLSHDRRFGSSR
jgi:hypothetical protein